jgi:four helix bundle protein
MKIERFEDIEGWQLAREVYACTGAGDFSRDFGLRDQIRRAASSVMRNIAEGFDAASDAEFTRFLRHVQRSCTEVQSELYVAFDQKYLNEQQFNQLYELAKRTPW